MRYRVLYSIDDRRASEEIEAASPHEAVVKFRLTRPDHEEPAARRCQVLSVMVEPVCDELPR